MDNVMKATTSAAPFNAAAVLAEVCRPLFVTIAVTT
jgi:hypothetical protein